MSLPAVPAARRGQRPQAGFTLIELLVVLGLAALAVTIVGGGAQAYLERARYQQAVREVASGLQQARALSVGSGAPVWVGYRPQSRQLQLGTAAVLDLPSSVDVHWQALGPARVDAEGELVPLFRFNADGDARGGTLTVSRGGRGVRFQVNWLLGLVEQAPSVDAS